MTDIAKLAPVAPREAWAHEARDFTPWLADNVEHLGEAVGLTLEVEGVEVSVGPFSADILARDLDGNVVLIENQLEATDHTHLGQILTYLAGLEAKTIIWVATDFREPHLSAIHWLNEHTAPEFSFIAVRLRVVRIGDSPLAPIFDVLARPNEWDRRISSALKEKTGDQSPVAKLRMDYWAHYLAMFPQDAEIGVSITGTPSNWLKIEGVPDLVVAIYKSKHYVGVFLRGLRGVSEEQTYSHILPNLPALMDQLGDCSAKPSETGHLTDSFRVGTDDPENWSKAADWQHHRAHAFRQAVADLFG